MKTEPMTPFGQALLSYYNGNTEATVIIRRDDGVTAPLPAGYFFRKDDDLSRIEKTALAQCKGHTLDIGAGSGLHSLILQKNELRVTAIDISPELTGLMEQRGVRDIRTANIFEFKGGPFDTLLMMGHGIGIAGDLNGLDRFLLQARDLVNKNGQVLLDSMDVSLSTDIQNQAYQDASRKSGNYIGVIKFRMEFGDIIGPYFNWLHVDPVTLAKHADKSGWKCEILLSEENGEYLARLDLIK
jgi:hypothetical protein